MALTYSSQRVAYPYFVVALLLFALQVIVGIWLPWLCGHDPAGIGGYTALQYYESLPLQTSWSCGCSLGLWAALTSWCLKNPSATFSFPL
jgi:nitric oxide reductase large subunit